LKRENYRAGFVALLGEPNAGKSTLLNTILGDKISIVSEKPQTTRSRVHGIWSSPEAQIIFVDAPGTIESTSGINEYLKDEVSDVIARTDVVLVVLAADTVEATARKLLEMAKASDKPFQVVITKGDLLTGERAPKGLPALLEMGIPFVVISAMKRAKEASKEVLNLLTPLLPPADAALYDEELLTTETMRKISAEFVREACFRYTRQEVPYGLAVRVTKYVEPEENEDGSDVTKIYCEIIVEKTAHKAIVIGAKASNLKKIGTDARKAIERILGSKVFLDLHVDVREGWTRNKRILKELGYVVVKE
jgi:GTP-binding protein Era